MSRRPLAAAAAVLLAVLGGVLILNYVSGADARAQADEELVGVLVVSTDVAAGTTAAELSGSVTTEQVPQRLVADGAVADLSTVDSSFITNAELLPGEQLLTARFSDPSVTPAGTVAKPAGTVEVSVSIDAQRAVGGALSAGDVVAVQVGATTIQDITVTRINAPDDVSGSYLVTLALSVKQAAKVTRASADQAVWLSLQSSGSTSTSTTSTSSTSTSTTTTATLGDDQ